MTKEVTPEMVRAFEDWLRELGIEPVLRDGQFGIERWQVEEALRRLEEKRP